MLRILFSHKRLTTEPLRWRAVLPANFHRYESRQRCGIGAVKPQHIALMLLNRLRQAFQCKFFEPLENTVLDLQILWTRPFCSVGASTWLRREPSSGFASRTTLQSLQRLTSNSSTFSSWSFRSLYNRYPGTDLPIPGSRSLAIQTASPRWALPSYSRCLKKKKKKTSKQASPLKVPTKKLATHRPMGLRERTNQSFTLSQNGYGAKQFSIRTRISIPPLFLKNGGKNTVR